MAPGIGAEHGEPNLTERTTHRLLDEITGGAYAAGQVLPPEQAIAERLGVSRTVVREAVARLKTDGIVVSKQGRGLVVIRNTRPSVLRIHAAADGDTERILGIVELRRGFEVEAAGLAAQRRTQQDLDVARAALVDMREALACGDVPAGVDADLAFHRAVARATQNDHFRNFFDFLVMLIRRNLEVSRFRSAQAGRDSRAQQEHEALFAALEVRDAEGARRLAREHIDNTESRLRSLHYLERERSALAHATQG